MVILKPIKLELLYDQRFLGLDLLPPGITKSLAKILSPLIDTIGNFHIKNSSDLQEKNQ